MEQHGFIQDMLDVKVLILFVMAKLSYPVSLQKIYELCYQDDKLSYFDVSVAVPQMVQSGHLEQLPDFIAELCLRDDAGILMRLELSAPTLSQARGLTRAYEKQADSIYQQMMTLLLDGSGEKHADV